MRWTVKMYQSISTILIAWDTESQAPSFLKEFIINDLSVKLLSIDKDKNTVVIQIWDDKGSSTAELEMTSESHSEFEALVGKDLNLTKEGALTERKKGLRAIFQDPRRSSDRVIKKTYC